MPEHPRTQFFVVTSQVNHLYNVSFQSYQATVKTLYSSDWLRLFNTTLKGEIGKRLILIETQR